MGFRVLLIAVSGKEPHAVQRDYGLVPTGRRQDGPGSPIVGTVLPNGAYLLYINDDMWLDCFFEADELFTRLSKGASLIACYAYENPMISCACGWTDGMRRWSVLHDAGQGIKHLETSGILPVEMQPIRDRLFSKQNKDRDGDIDYVFDIPVELFVALGGIRYNYDIPGAGPEPWEILDIQE